MDKKNIRELIFNSNDISKEIITVKEWGNVEIEIKQMTAGERTKLLGQAFDQKTDQIDTTKVYAEVIIMCTYIPGTNEKVFNLPDRDMLNKKNGKVIEKIALKILDSNTVTDESKEEVEKN